MWVGIVCVLASGSLVYKIGGSKEILKLNIAKSVANLQLNEGRTMEIADMIKGATSQNYFMSMSPQSSSFLDPVILTSESPGLSHKPTVSLPPAANAI